MNITTMRRAKKPSLIEIIVNDFKGGVNSYIAEERLAKNTLRAAQNKMLDQDGVLIDRWGTKTYITLPKPDGIGTYTTDDNGTLVEHMIAVVEGVVMTSTDGGAWASVDGETLTAGYEVDMLQIDDKVFLANKVDSLMYFDIEENEVFAYEALSAPSAPSLTRSSDLTSGSYTGRWRISAVNEIGETIASASTSITIDIPRTQWRTTDTIEQYIDLSWSAVTGAKRYNIYYSDMVDDECYIDSVSDSSYRDDGRAYPNIAVKYPLDDTTGGPTVGSVSSSDNRIFATQDPANIYRVYWTGVGRYINAFSPYFGGGWVDINKGSGEIPVRVRSYRDGRGEPVNVVFTTTVSGEGSQYQLALSSLTVGTTTFIVPLVARVVGSYGTAAKNAVIEAKDNLFFPSTQGIFTTGAKPDLLNVLATDEVSLAIRDAVRGISNKHSHMIVGQLYDNKIFWAVPASGNSKNTEIWLLDLELKAWMRPWTIGVQKFITYTPSDGKERLMALLNTPDDEGNYRIVEFSPNYRTDDGVNFESFARLSLMHFDEGHMSFARVEDIHYEILRMSGRMNITLSGTAMNRPFATIKTLNIVAPFASSGYSTEAFSKIRYSQPSTYPTSISEATTKKRMKVRKLLNNMQITFRSAGSSAGISTIFIRAAPKRTRPPAAWKT